jgi:chromosome partitioning protein
MTHVVAVLNQKGGVGKTTLTINLGSALGHLGKRVLLVDFDPQGHLTEGVGMQEIYLAEEVPTLYESLSRHRSRSSSDPILPNPFPLSHPAIT